MMAAFDQLMNRPLGNSGFYKSFWRNRFNKCKSLYRKDLFGHFGCVNAIEFSKDGEWLASGGDDRRILLWNLNKAVRQYQSNAIQMRTEHLSNIFSTVFDNSGQHIFSAGNDDKVIRHNINRQEAIGYFQHEEPVYCVSLPSEDENLFATAGEGGTVLIWDVRVPENNKLCLAVSSSSFHGVSFNPVESRLIATANANEGIVLFDLRYPENPVIKYDSPEKRKGAMFAKFNQLGTQILALMRRTGPALFNIHDQEPIAEFCHSDYSNVCTMKSPCFVGDADQYVAAGSDDFNIYIWKIPGHDWKDLVVNDPFMVLEGHRSIVNQTRYNHYAQTFASSGVEKVVKLWSQFELSGGTGCITEQQTITKRQFYSHEQYMQFIVDSGEPLNHDYNSRSVEEDPRMMAFFDSLIHRVNAGWFSDGSSDEESPIDDILQRLIDERNEEDSDDQSNFTVMDLRRLFRSNRRMLMAQLDDAEEDEDLATAAESGSDVESSGPIRFSRSRSMAQPSDVELNSERSLPIVGVVTSELSNGGTQHTIRNQEIEHNVLVRNSSAADNSLKDEHDNSHAARNIENGQTQSLYNRMQNFMTSPCAPKQTETSNSALCNSRQTEKPDSVPHAVGLTGNSKSVLHAARPTENSVADTVKPTDKSSSVRRVVRQTDKSNSPTILCTNNDTTRLEIPIKTKRLENNVRGRDESAWAMNRNQETSCNNSNGDGKNINLPLKLCENNKPKDTCTVVNHNAAVHNSGTSESNLNHSSMDTRWSDSKSSLLGNSDCKLATVCADRQQSSISCRYLRDDCDMSFTQNTICTHDAPLNRPGFSSYSASSNKRPASSIDYSCIRPHGKPFVPELTGTIDGISSVHEEHSDKNDQGCSEEGQENQQQFKRRKQSHERKYRTSNKR